MSSSRAYFESERLERRAKAAAKQHEWSAAEQLASEALALSPTPAYDVYDLRLCMRERLGQYDEALADAQRMVRLQPQRAKAYLRRGKLLQMMGRDGDALESYDLALRRVDFKDSLYKTMQRARSVLQERMFSTGRRYDILALLPIELVLRIFSYVDFASVVRCTCVCRKWKRTINATSEFYARVEMPSEREIAEWPRRPGLSPERALRTYNACMLRYLKNAGASLRVWSNVNAALYNRWKSTVADMCASGLRTLVLHDVQRPVDLSMLPALRHLTLEDVPFALVCPILMTSVALESVHVLRLVEQRKGHTGTVASKHLVSLRSLRIDEYGGQTLTAESLATFTSLVENCSTLEELDTPIRQLSNMDLTRTALRRLSIVWTPHWSVMAKLPATLTDLKVTLASLDGADDTASARRLAAAASDVTLQSLTIAAPHFSGDPAALTRWYAEWQGFFASRGVAGLPHLCLHNFSSNFETFSKLLHAFPRLERLEIVGSIDCDEQWVSSIAKLLPRISHVRFDTCPQVKGRDVLGMVETLKRRRTDTHKVSQPVLESLSCVGVDITPATVSHMKGSLGVADIITDLGDERPAKRRMLMSR